MQQQYFFAEKSTGINGDDRQRAAWEPAGRERDDPERSNSGTPAVLLSSVRPGQRVKIVSLEGSCTEIARLAEMGLRRGVELIALRTGKTSIVQINRYQLCLRLGIGTTVMVRPVG